MALDDSVNDNARWFDRSGQLSGASHPADEVEVAETRVLYYVLSAYVSECIMDSTRRIRA